ncbi:hypothetical protein LCGC14_1474080 [marine sediment metagenome]|uniref:Uncharacterized protein n=1 Tax=marine sediment metagenome TaxID=412755 RepID=A0A0F9JBG2_9ZZZZ
MAKKKLPDSVINDLLSGAAPDSTAISQQASKPLQKYTSKPLHQDTSEVVKRSYYIELDVLNDLEDALPALRRLTTGKRGDINNSGIVNAALRLALDEFNEKGEESRIAAMLVER